MHTFSRSTRLVIEFLLHALLTAFALLATWITWPDAYIDFSREPCLPRRVSCGDVLFAPLASTLAVHAPTFLSRLPP